MCVCVCVLFNGISTFVGNSMLKSSFQKNNSDTIQSIVGGIRRFICSPSSKVNVIARLEFDSLTSRQQCGILAITLERQPNTYIYIYIYGERKRVIEIERERETKNQFMNILESLETVTRETNLVYNLEAN